MHSEYQAETYFFLGKIELPDDAGAAPDGRKENRADSDSKQAVVHDDAWRGKTKREAL